MAFLLFLLALGLRLSWLARDFSSRGGFLYQGAFTKVVPFDDTMAAATIRADPLSSYTSSFEPRFLGVLWNLVSSTLML